VRRAGTFRLERQGDSVLRIVLAGGGFLGFAGLYLALLVANKRTQSA
jgi:hypothetical protein